MSFPPSPLPDLSHLLSGTPWLEIHGKGKASFLLPLRFPSLYSWLSHTTSSTGQSLESMHCTNCPNTQPDNPTVVDSGTSQLTPLPSLCAGGGAGEWLAPLFLLPPSLLLSPWAQLASDSGPLKSLLQPTGLGPWPAPPAPGSSAESSPLLPED